MFHGLASGSVYFKLDFSSMHWTSQDTFVSWHSLWSQTFMSQHVTCHLWVGTVGHTSFPEGDFYTWITGYYLTRHWRNCKSHNYKPKLSVCQLILSQIPWGHFDSKRWRGSTEVREKRQKPWLISIKISYFCKFYRNIQPFKQVTRTPKTPGIRYSYLADPEEREKLCTSRLSEELRLA